MSRTLTLARDGLVLEGLLDEPEDVAGHVAAGHAAAPLVMLVHGFPDTPQSWRDVVPGLLAAGFRVFRPWLRGYTGGSARRAARYDLIAVADDLVAWREHLAGGSGTLDSGSAGPAASAAVDAADRAPVHLVGHDWGAVAAMTAVAGNAAGWASLGVLAIPPLQRFERAGALLPVQARQSSYMLLLQSGASPWLIRQRDCAYLRRLWHRWSPGWAFTENDFAPVRQAFASPAVAHAATRYYRSLFTPQRAATRAFYARLRRPLATPVLALAGADDGCLHAGLLDRIVDPALFPAGVRTVTLPGCGHFLHAERPQAVLDELLTHLRATSA